MAGNLTTNKKEKVSYVDMLTDHEKIKSLDYVDRDET